MSSTNFAPYIYKPLQTDDTIRIIELLPGPRDSPLRCILTNQRRNRIVTDYEALSYASEDVDLKGHVVEAVTQTTISITDDLYRVLQALRRRAKSRWLWVRAMCIDQTNVRDRCHHVLQMPEIYSEAQEVVVWVGDNVCQESMATIARVGRLLSIPGGAIDEGETDRHIAIEQAHAIRSLEMQVIENFFGKPWFGEVWGFMEFILAKQVRLQAGRHYMSYRLFRNAVYACRDRALSSTVTSSKHFPNLRRVSDLVLFRDRYRSTGRLISKSNHGVEEEALLLRTLKILADRYCSDERDRFYAMFAFLPDQIKMTPSYTLSSFEVRMAMTKKSLLAGVMSILDYAENAPHGYFGSSLLIRVPQPSDRSESWRLVPFHPTRNYSPLSRMVGGRTPQVSSVGRSTTVYIRGVAIDRVVNVLYIKEASDNTTNEPSLNNATFDTGPALASHLPIVYEHFKNFRLTHSRRTKPKSANLRREFWHTIHCDSEMGDPQVGNDEDFEALLASHDVSAALFQHRIFFSTESGLFGICSRWVRTGHRIVLFDGVKKPYMLRSAGSMWELVGDAFIAHKPMRHQFRAPTLEKKGRWVLDGTIEGRGRVGREVCVEGFEIC